MARTRSRVLLAACLVLAGFAVRPAGAADDPTRRQRNVLAVQVALEQGTALVQRGDYASAVAVLEKQIAHIDGNRQYLAALRDAYRGYVAQLEREGKQADARKYRGFLEILDPSARTARPAEPVAVAPTAPAAVDRTRPPAAIVPRAKVEEDDPFAESNAANGRARLAFERAEKEFGERHFEEAARAYAQAERLQPGIALGANERWAYCQLFAIARGVNTGNPSAPPDELERQVKAALRLAPRLDKFGTSLLEKIRDSGTAGSSARVAIKHTPRHGNGWAMAETTNFRIFHHLNENEAEQLARAAEATRATMTRKWFGDDSAAWSPRCDVYVHPTSEAYARATGAPASAPGHSTISLDAGRVVSRRIDLRADNPYLQAADLPHETTHVVLAGGFGKHHVPRWADEGMAVLTEPRDRVDQHLKNLAMYDREGTLFRAGELMQMSDYPEPRRISPFYAQSVSLVGFLCQKKDPITFTRFLRAALDGRYESALQTYYGYNSFAELEADWKQQALGAAAVASVAEKRR
ncbi:MAG: hypothetical protein U0736_01660 [Gemmataceae bacterium]